MNLWSGRRIVWPACVCCGSARRSSPCSNKWGDNLRINWGYFYLGVPDVHGSALLAATNEDDRDRFVATGELPEEDDLDQPRMPQSHYPPPPLLAVALPLGQVGASPVSRRVLLATMIAYSIEYMHQKLLPYWRKQFPSFAEMLEAAERDIRRWKSAPSSMTPN